MAVLEQQIPAATWQVDPVHSSVGFGIKHMVSTFKGVFEDYDVSLVRGDAEDPEAHRRRAGRERQDQAAGHHRPSADARTSSTPRQPGAPLRVDRVPRRRRRAAWSPAISRCRGVTKPVEGRGTFSFVEADMAGAPRIGVELETVIDRTEYGINWNADLPKGGKALANDVTITIHVELVQGLDDAGPRHIRKRSPGFAQHRSAPGGGDLLPPGVDLVWFDRLRKSRSTTTTRSTSRRRRSSELRAGDRGRRRRADRDAGVQPLDSWRAQERARLGVAAGRRTACSRASRSR